MYYESIRKKLCAISVIHPLVDSASEIRRGKYSVYVLCILDTGSDSLKALHLILILLSWKNEGKDGNALLVHSSCYFVFKGTLHLWNL